MLGNHIPLDKLASFSENLARCLAAGLSVPASLKSSGFALGPHFSSHLAAIRKQTEAGQELGLALKSLENQLPVFFIPTIQCGDETGRTPELLLYLAEHCRMMHRTWKTLRHTWLLPLATIVTFSCLRLLIYFFLHPLRETILYLGQLITMYGGLFVVVLMIQKSPQARLVVDHLRLRIPWFGNIDRDLALSRFFHLFAVFYTAAVMRVDKMVETSAVVSQNVVVRTNFHRAADEIRNGATIFDALTSSLDLEGEQKAMLATGEETGKFEEASSHIARTTEDSVKARLDVFNQIARKAIAIFIVLAILSNTLSLAVLLFR